MDSRDYSRTEEGFSDQDSSQNTNNTNNETLRGKLVSHSNFHNGYEGYL